MHAFFGFLKIIVFPGEGGRSRYKRRIFFNAIDLSLLGLVRTCLINCDWHFTLSPFWNKAANARSLLGFSLFYIQLKQKYTPLSDANMPEYKPLYKYILYTIHIFKLSPRPSCYHVPTPPPRSTCINAV